MSPTSHPEKPLPRSRGPKPTRVDPNQILDAAEEVFALEGLKGASLRAIAQRAGCDPALIYYHFESKEAMFIALLDRCMPGLAEDLLALALPSDTRHSAVRLWDVLQAYNRHMGHHSGMRSVVRGEIIRGAEGIQEHLAGRFKITSGAIWQILRQGIERGELRADLMVEFTAFFLVKLYLEILDYIPNMAPRITGLPKEEALPLAVKAWFELFWRGVAADPTTPIPDYQ